MNLFFRQEVIQQYWRRKTGGRENRFICEWKCFISPLDGHRNRRNHTWHLSPSERARPNCWGFSSRKRSAAESSHTHILLLWQLLLTVCPENDHFRKRPHVNVTDERWKKVSLHFRSIHLLQNQNKKAHKFCKSVRLVRFYSLSLSQSQITYQ